VPTQALQRPDADRVTTLALLIRKPGLSASLFSRYWRDVHGVLAARIPGFESYTQYHLGRPFDGVRPQGGRRPAKVRFDGIAEVTFANAGMRAGLASSDVTKMIQEDEQNVFGTSLLFNLDENASHTLHKRPDAQPCKTVFLLFGSLPGSTSQGVAAALDALLAPTLGAMPALQRMRCHLLRTEDSLGWRTAGVQNTQTDDTAFDAIVQIDFSGTADEESLRSSLAAAPPALFEIFPRIDAYPVRGRYVLVEHGRPTELGLRGLDTMRTIEAAGAVNQRSAAVLRCVYGESGLGVG
jgi:hypothetical protein